MSVALHKSSMMNSARSAERAAGRLASRRTAVAPSAILGFLTGNNPKTREQRKNQLLAVIGPLKRGAAADEEDKAAVDAAARALEAVNPNRKSLASPLVNGKWELLYTTSQSILGTTKPPPLRPSGPIYQIIDAVNAKARNVETAPLFNQVSADLQPMSSSKVAVQFKQFKILGLIPVTAPPTARGELDITYVDEDLRVSRGDKGNLFVLSMVDPEARP